MNFRAFRLLAALAAVFFFQLPVSDARAFRIIASSSGSAGIAGAPCCDTGFDGGFELSTSPLTGTPPAVNVLNSGGSRSFDVPRTDAGSSTVSLSGMSRASLFDIGASANVSLVNWDENLTGGSIEAFASARLEQVFTPTSAADLWIRPVFQIDGSVSHAAGLVSTLSFIMRPGGGSDVELLRIDGGPSGTTQELDLQLIGPELFVPAGGGIFLALALSTQVSGSVDFIPEGDHFGEVDAFNTLSIVGFETFSDPEFTVPVRVDFASDSGEVLSTIPEPGTAMLIGLGLGAMALRRRGSRGRPLRRATSTRAAPTSSPHP